MLSTVYNIKKIQRGIILSLILFVLVCGVFYAIPSTQKENFFIENPYWLFGLISLPLFAVFYYTHLKWKNKALTGYADKHLLDSLVPPSSNSMVIFRYALWQFAIGFLFIALANPQFGTEKISGKVKGAEIVICMDVSNSMLVKDLSKKKSRLALARRSVAKSLNEDFGNDKIGLIYFANAAYRFSPLTTDYAMLRRGVESLSPEMVSAQGSNLGDAIERSVELFDPESENTKALIIVSDGEDHEDYYEEAIASAKSKGIKIYTVGVGTETGGQVPEYHYSPEEYYPGYENSARRNLDGYKRDRYGNLVISKLQDKSLKMIAEKSGGLYFKAVPGDFKLKEIYSTIETNKQSTESEDATYRDFKDYFQLFLFLALVCVIIDTFIYHEKWRFRNFNPYAQ